MRSKIKILNATRFTKDNKLQSRVGFIIVDGQYNKNNPSFKGFSELACYYDGDNAFNLITNEMLNVDVTAEFENRTNQINPMRSTNVLKSFEHGRDVISLL